MTDDDDDDVHWYSTVNAGYFLQHARYTKQNREIMTGKCSSETSSRSDINNILISCFVHRICNCGNHLQKSSRLMKIIIKTDC